MSDMEKFTFENFDPDDLSNWDSVSAQEFIRILVHEMRRENIKLSEYFKILNKSHERQDMISASEKELTLEDCLDIFLMSNRISGRLIDVLNAYAIAKLDDTVLDS